MHTIRQPSGQGTALAGFGGWLSLFQAARGLFGRSLSLVALWQERARQRHDLAELDDRLLKDIGLNRGVIAREIDKPFWRA